MSKKKEKTTLNHAEFVVLGLVSEESSHAYKINKKIEERGMRNWTNIGRSSIYRVLKHLEKADFIRKWIEEVDNRVLKVYQVTENGIKILKKLIFKILKEYIGRNDEDYYVAFSMLPYLSQEQQIEAFTNSLNIINKHKKELEEMLESITQYPLNVTGLFIHPIQILGTDIKFLEWVLEEIKNGGGQFDPEAYNK
ncbi:MAG: PadR family transcriptional regulator [Candidatus Lokiarchaeota archaeon]|nr:PadR family transcriptional regulator [Candidatus Lokiarchaeota archaeon]